MIGGIVASVALLVGAPLAGVLAVAAWDAHRQRRDRSELCCCIHTRAAHEHYRRGTDCGQCDCPGFVSAVRIARSRPAVPVGPPSQRRLRGVS